MHGGTESAKPAPGRGDRLRIDAPLHGRHARGPSGPLILVIEFSVRLETALVTSLIEQGADVVHASDFSGAEKILESIAPDGVIVALAAGLPTGVRPGLELVPRLLADRTLPLVILPVDRLSAEERALAKGLQALVMPARYVKRVFQRNELLSFLLAGVPLKNPGAP